MTNSPGCLQQKRRSDCTGAQLDACLYPASTLCRATMYLQQKKPFKCCFAGGQIVASLKTFAYIDSSWRCHGVVCSLWLWYFLTILTYYFWPDCKIWCPSLSSQHTMSDHYLSASETAFKCRFAGGRIVAFAYRDSDQPAKLLGNCHTLWHQRRNDWRMWKILLF